jgi:probable F420-dependent oxidoreductase
MATTRQLRQRLGKFGIWMFPPSGLGLDPAEYGKAIESAGFGSVWFGRAEDAASMDEIGQVLGGTRELCAATGIASIWHWDPAALAARSDQLAAAHDDRFILGLGNSHALLIESTMGQPYAKPYSRTVQFLDDLPGMRAPVVLAALGPKMLELSRDRALGAHPYFSPPEHTAFARQVLGPGPLLIPEVAVALDDGAEGAASARAYARNYLMLPNYTSNLRRFGYTDADLEGGGSDRLMSAIVPHGRAQALARVNDHLAAGADHVLVQLLGPRGASAPGDLAALSDLLAP